MNQFNPLKYRGVFDRPIIQTCNLLPSGKQDSDAPGRHMGPADPPETSLHILEFMGWGQRRRSKFVNADGTREFIPEYSGRVKHERVLDQRDKWIQLWLQKGRYEDERRQQREAAKTSGLSAQKSARSGTGSQKTI